jgi:hypothetical protein
MGSTSPYFFIFALIISVPASPKPNANNVPILTIVFSILTVSFEFSFYITAISVTIYGSFAILLIFSIILSNGLNAKSFESFENINAPNVNTALTNNVLIIDNILVMTADYLVLKIPTTSGFSLSKLSTTSSGKPVV